MEREQSKVWARGQVGFIHTDKAMLTDTRANTPRTAYTYPYSPDHTPAGSWEHACSHGSHPSELSHLLTPQFLVAMALGAQEVLQQAQQPKHLLAEAGQDPSGGLLDVGQGRLQHHLQEAGDG